MRSDYSLKPVTAPDRKHRSTATRQFLSPLMDRPQYRPAGDTFRQLSRPHLPLQPYHCAWQPGLGSLAMGDVPHR